MKDFINEWANDCNVKVLDWRYYEDKDPEYGWIKIEGESITTNTIAKFKLLSEKHYSDYGISYEINEIEFKSDRITLWFE